MYGEKKGEDQALGLVGLQIGLSSQVISKSLTCCVINSRDFEEGKESLVIYYVKSC